MKKIILIIVILMFTIPVKADLTNEQQENVKIFTEKFVETGLNKKDSNGYPLLAYMQGQARIDGYQSKLYYVRKDYNAINTVNGYKWTFDCASFASFIYRHMFDLILTTATTSTKDSYSGLTILEKNGNPYMVSNFVKDADNKTRFYYVQRNVSIDTIDYSKMQPGDLIIIKGSHIMVYIGDGKMAHASSKSIANNKHLGIEISTLEKKYPTSKFYIIRIKDKVINPNNKGNMIITWPDDGKTTNFSKNSAVTKPPVEEKPVVIPPVVKEPEITVPKEEEKPKLEEKVDEKIPNDKPQITYKNLSKEWQTSLNLNYTISDLDGISAYSVSNTSKPKYLTISIESKLNKVYKITENGTYYIYAKDIRNNISNVKIEINNIDRVSPKILSIKTNNNEIVVLAEDNESGLNSKAYSFDGKEWSENNHFKFTQNRTYSIKVRDVVGNITYSSILISSIKTEEIKKEEPKENVNTDNNQETELKENNNENIKENNNEKEQLKEEKNEIKKEILNNNVNKNNKIHNTSSNKNDIKEDKKENSLVLPEIFEFEFIDNEEQIGKNKFNFLSYININNYLTKIGLVFIIISVLVILYLVSINIFTKIRNYK